MLGEVGALVIGEPTGNYPLVGHKGALWLDVMTRGITAHGSMPEHGDNAIYKAASAHPLRSPGLLELTMAAIAL